MNEKVGGWGGPKASMDCSSHYC